MFVVSAVHFTPYLKGLSRPMLIRAWGARCRWRAHFQDRMPWLESQTSQCFGKHSTIQLCRQMLYIILCWSTCSTITSLASTFTLWELAGMMSVILLSTGIFCLLCFPFSKVELDWLNDTLTFSTMVTCLDFAPCNEKERMHICQLLQFS